MNKWGDWDQIEIRLLERVNTILARQQAVAGGSVNCPDFSPGKVIMDNSATRGLAIMEKAGNIVVALGSIAINNFMLGYLYRLAEAGSLDRLLAEMDAQTEIGGVQSDSESDSGI